MGRALKDCRFHFASCLVFIFAVSAAFPLPLGAAVSGATMAHSARPSTDELKYRNELSVDLSAVYVRDTQPTGLSDTAGRLNLGGMFSHWIGLDAVGMYEMRARSYLVGADIKLVPIDWFFLKAGAGAFADKATHEMKATPLFGGGLTGRFSEYYYVVAEGISFQTPDNRRNIGFGIGLGTIF